MTYFKRRRAIKEFRKQIKEETRLRHKERGLLFVIVQPQDKGCVYIMEPRDGREAVAATLTLLFCGPGFGTWPWLYDNFDIYTPGDAVEEAMRQGVEA